MRYIAIAVFALVSHAVPAATLSVVSPADKAVVPLLSADQRAYLDMLREERRAQFACSHARERIAAFGDRPQKVTLRWRLDGTNGTARVRYAVRVVREPDGAPFWQGETEETHVRLNNFEVARAYSWKVTAKTAEGDVSAGGTFVTEDRAPRLVHLHGVPNMRDIGGRRGLDGRRVRQGRVYRSAGLNDNSKKAGLWGRLWGRRTPGKERMNDATRRYAKEVLGIRTDIDLRSSKECYGMTGSPLGPEVAWLRVSSSAYEDFHEKKGREAFTEVFRFFLDEARYPLVFHCIAGADRTGSLAFVLKALLGVDEDELYKDWEVTGFSKGNIGFRHEKRFDWLVKGFSAYPGETIHERVEAFVKSCGFTDADIARFRNLMLE